MKLKHITMAGVLAIATISLASCKTNVSTSSGNSTVVDTTTNAVTTTAGTTTVVDTTTQATTTVATTTAELNTNTTTQVSTTTNPVSTTTNTTTAPVSTTTNPVSTTTNTTTAPIATTSDTQDVSTTQGEVAKDGQVDIIASAGEQESAYVEFKPVSGATSYNIYVQGGKYTHKTLVNTDVAYTREISSSKMRTDLIGLTKDNYLIDIVPVYGEEESNATPTEVSVLVSEYDRSGYAHFKYSQGVGAYNDDGSLKEDAIVIYVTDQNKNTVMKDICEKYSELSMFQIPSYYTNDYMGQDANSIGWWLNNTQFSKAEKDSKGNIYEPQTGRKTSDTYDPNGASLGFAQLGTEHPIVVRFVGEVTAPEGLTVYDSYKLGGSEGDNGMMARMKNLLNVTIEGVGDDAIIEGWGFHFISADTTGTYGKSFEARNLTFDKYAEDALGMEGDQSNGVITKSVERCWVHHNTFLPGYCANPAESDKGEGDGSCDFKRGQYFTMSYNYYEYCHKTNLVGSADDSLQFNLSFHHNYWYNCGSRMPLLRQANIHFYNNYIYGDSSDSKSALSYVSSVRAGAYMFAEANYYEGCKQIVELKSGAVKAFNNAYVQCFNGDGSTRVDARETSVPASASCNYNGTSFQDFDTNSTLFYYDQSKNKSDCYLTTPEVARHEVIMNAGSRYRTNLDKASATIVDSGFSGVTPANAVNVPSEGVFTATIPTSKGSTIVDNIVWNNITGSSNGEAKIRGNGLTFKLSTYATLTVTGSASSTAALNPISIVKEDGTVVAGDYGSVVLAPGIYTITSCQKDKDSNIASLTFEKFDSEALKEQLISEYNAAYALIPSEITFTDSCYEAISNAITAYEALGDFKSEVSTNPYNQFNEYIALNVSYVEQLISAIGTVSSESSQAIALARSAYNSLIAKDSTAVVSNYNVLVAAEAEYQSYAVDGCVALINAIGTVTLDSKEAITLARTAYEALSNTQKEQVSNYSVLEAAEATYNDLYAVNAVEVLINNTSLEANQSAIKAVIDAYNGLTDTQKAKVTSTEKLSQLKVQYVINLIASLPATITYSDAASVNEAKNEYEKLTTEEKSSVTNYSKLETAIKALDDLGIETVSSYNSGDLTNGWTVTGGTATSTSTTAAVHTGSSLVAVSSFALESLSSVTITAQVNDKGSTTFSFYYSLDGGETWQLFSSGKAGVNGSSTDIALTGTAVTGPVLVKLVVTCTKAESNAKSVSITNIKIA